MEKEPSGENLKPLRLALGASRAWFRSNQVAFFFFYQFLVYFFYLVIVNSLFSDYNKIDGLRCTNDKDKSEQNKNENNLSQVSSWELYCRIYQ